jgi:GAF domain
VVGAVTFESLSQKNLSIIGSTGPDDCFNSEYALLYQAGRVRAIADIESEPIHTCHRDFLRSMQIKANLVVPVLNLKRLWGLLIAHQCQSTHSWSPNDMEVMQQGAYTLASSTAIRESWSNFSRSPSFRADGLSLSSSKIPFSGHAATSASTKTLWLQKLLQVSYL